MAIFVNYTLEQEKERIVVVVVVVVLPGPQSFRLMLVADESGLPAELYST